MKKILAALLFMSISPLQAQHILTLGLGFSASFYDAEKMQNFSNTYNFVNQNNLGSLMQGINGAEGLRYRSAGRPNWGSDSGVSTLCTKK
ncbi:MAG: hypothetical protein E2O77_02260 [Caldithrix sp.]|nr:MAG: hypothetical protein E2O77_02260 [Caldithrix sp.]